MVCVPSLPIPASTAAFWNTRQIHGYDHGNRPSLNGLAKSQLSRAGNCVVCFHALSTSSSPLSILRCPCEPAVLVSPTCWHTIPLSTVSSLATQSTSAQRRARHSLIRKPRQQHSNAIVRNGSERCLTNL